jgi:UDP-galactopyranose mutase
MAEGDPYYPVPRPENAELYKKYQLLAMASNKVHFVGRLATYKYYNMDQVVAQSLTLFKNLISTHENGKHVNGRKTPLVTS